MRQLLQGLNEQGKTLIISSHILGELSKIATHYGIIKEGSLVEQISREELAKKCNDYFQIEVDGHSGVQTGGLNKAPHAPGCAGMVHSFSVDPDISRGGGRKPADHLYAWGEEYLAEDKTINVHISNIRAKLKDSGTDRKPADHLQSGGLARSISADKAVDGALPDFHIQVLYGRLPFETPNVGQGESDSESQVYGAYRHQERGPGPGDHRAFAPLFPQHTFLPDFLLYPYFLKSPFLSSMMISF